MGDSAVTESETAIISEIESERNLTFSPLRTSHGGQYRCTAVITIPSDSTTLGYHSNKFLIVQSK